MGHRQSGLVSRYDRVGIAIAEASRTGQPQGVTPVLKMEATRVLDRRLMKSTLMVLRATHQIGGEIDFGAVAPRSQLGVVFLDPGLQQNVNQCVQTGYSSGSKPTTSSAWLHS